VGGSLHKLRRGGRVRRVNIVSSALIDTIRDSGIQEPLYSETPIVIGRAHAAHIISIYKSLRVGAGRSPELRGIAEIVCYSISVSILTS